MASQPTEEHGQVDHRKQYWIVFLFLFILTAIEVYIAEYTSTGMGFRISSLTFLAVAKAVMVAYYYMHLNHETKWMKFIAAIPISAGIYGLVVILESIYR